MFSVMYTGMNLFPLCTAIVWPTKSGMIIDARDQVFTTRFSLRWFISWIRARSRSSTKGPFLSERAISPPLLLAASTHDVLRRRLALLAGLVSLRGLAPRGRRMPSARRLALAAAQRVVDRVHRLSADLGPLAAPA